MKKIYCFSIDRSSFNSRFDWFFSSLFNRFGYNNSITVHSFLWGAHDYISFNLTLHVLPSIDFDNILNRVLLLNNTSCSSPMKCSVSGIPINYLFKILNRNSGGIELYKLLFACRIFPIPGKSIIACLENDLAWSSFKIYP